MTDYDDEFNPDLEIENVGYGNKGGFDKPGIVSTSVHSCIIKRSVEMRPGYTTYIKDKFGNVFAKVIPDTRKEYFGSIIALTALLSFEIESYKKIKESYEKFIVQKKEIKEKYAYSERIFEIDYDKDKRPITDCNGSFIPKITLVNGGRKWIPEKTDLLSTATTAIKKGIGGTATKQLIIDRKMGIWDHNIDAYWEDMIELCDGWFATINTLISGEDYLDNFGRGVTM